MWLTKRLVLRSQGTALSARVLSKAKVPGKYFAVARCFRPDDVDATHAADFYQVEGIVLGEEVNLKTLLGLLKIFAEEHELLQNHCSGELLQLFKGVIFVGCDCLFGIKYVDFS